MRNHTIQKTDTKGDLTPLNAQTHKHTQVDLHFFELRVLRSLEFTQLDTRVSLSQEQTKPVLISISMVSVGFAPLKLLGIMSKY